MTLEEFEARLIAQGNACAICRGSISIVNAHVDHDHSSGAIRDLLCFGCNAGLGNMRDDPKRLRTAAAYLDYHDRKNGKLL